MSAVHNDALLGMLARWAANGWLRRLDAAFARFIAELCPRAEAPVLLAAALLAQMEGRGHTCLVVDDEALAEPERLLDSGPDAAQALRGVLAQLPGAGAAWRQALRACPAVFVEGHAADASEPLVLSGSRLYLRRYWRCEQRVAAQVLRRVANVDAVDEAAARLWLGRLFAPLPGGGPDWQKIACAIALRGRLSVITGGPGTGKTHTAARLLALLFATAPEPQRLRVALAAPTGKAAARLRQAIDGALDELQLRLAGTLPLRELASRIGPARTLHSLLGARPDTRRLRHSAANPLDVDVLIVDEASMVHLEMMDALLDALPDDVRVVLLGDKDQLASVEAGAVLGDLCRDAGAGRYRDETVRAVERIAGETIADGWVDPLGPALAQRTVMLRHSQRFGSAIGELARAVNRGDASVATTLLDTPPGAPVHWVAPPTPAAVLDLASAGRSGAAGGYRSYLELIRERPVDAASQARWMRAVLAAFERFRVLCAVREGEWGVVGLNRAIERRLEHDQLLDARGLWYEGRPVIVTRNDPALGVFNGDVGIALRATPDEPALRACFVDGDGVRSVSVSRLADVETAFALTVHKSQGSEFEHTVLVLPPDAGRVATRELVYTGITRARSALTLVSPRRDALAHAIGQTTRRSSGLQDLIHGERGAP
jgi:exodeoxyribonuclease V alpha subunit